MQTLTLVSRSDPVQRIKVSIDRTPVVLGRSDQSDVLIDDPQVSRQHAQMELREGTIWVVDLGSKNGTWLNNSRVELEPVAIHDGDELRFGDLAFEVQAADARTRTIPAAPSEETLTVLFTDLVGHSALFEELGASAARALVSEHIDAMQAEVARCGGTVVKTEGDGVIARFKSARDAVSCALAVQRWSNAAGSNERRIPIRVGINSGDAMRTSDDVLGPTVIKAARIVSCAEGGQVLVSEVTRLLLSPAKELAFASRGTVELKGFLQPEELFEVFARNAVD